MKKMLKDCKIKLVNLGNELNKKMTIERISFLMVAATYVYSAQMLIAVRAEISTVAWLSIILFGISTIVRFKYIKSYSIESFTGLIHLATDFFLTASIAYLTKSNVTLPIIISLTAMGASTRNRRQTCGVILLSALIMQVTYPRSAGLTGFSILFDELSGTLFTLLLVVGFTYIINELYLQKHQLFLQQKQLEEKHEELEKAYDALNISVIEQELLIVQRERNRMNGELHDHMGHALASSLIQMQYVKKVMFKDLEQAGKKIDQIYEHMNGAYEEIRKFVRIHNEPLKSEAGLNRLVAQIEKIKKTSQLKIEFENKSIFHFGGLSIEEETHILRIIQETLTNSMKHGKATCVRISIENIKTQDFEGVNITLLDDGKGSNLIVEGYGLDNLKRRANQLNGKIDFISSKGNGFKTVIQIPIEPVNKEIAV